ncbi:hypothetical protein [Enterobacter phage F20]|uniref:Uncharacterized protein n=1 Tax=Enterobacter phage F20 TaxID=2886900 RepID=G5DML7_9CAUD|nr:hypothetical protein FLA17_gp72 [Enterobacter phage F20]AEQ39245.1 hypothetical protein [Enterobacter phage F20]
MKAQTLLDIVNRNNQDFIVWDDITIAQLKLSGITHITVEADGSVFTWEGKQRPLAYWAHNCGKTINAGFLSALSSKHHGERDCRLGGIIGSIGYYPVNWHRMVYAVK